MLLCISLLVFAMLAWLMPQTYSNNLNTILDERAQGFVSELEQVPFSDSGGLFDQFIADMEINSVELYDSSGDFVPLPSKEFDNEWEGNIAQSAVAGLGEASPILSNYSCSWHSESDARIFPLFHTMVCLVGFPKQEGTIFAADLDREVVRHLIPGFVHIGNTVSRCITWEGHAYHQRPLRR